MPIDATVEVLQTDDGHRLPVVIRRARTPDAPLLVLVHEIFGVNEYMVAMASRYAQQGFDAAVPDLFARIEPGVDLGYSQGEIARGISLRDRLDTDRTLADIAAVTALAGTGRPTLVLGYCMGGGYAYLAASTGAFDAAVSYYGVGIQGHLDLADHIACPLQMHFAEVDPYCSEDDRVTIARALAHVRGYESFVYPGTRHAFATFGRDTFDRDATDLAEERSIRFLREAPRRSR